jgi:hypothetical protein
MTELSEAAVAYAKRGWPALPLHTREGFRPRREGR